VTGPPSCNGPTASRQTWQPDRNGDQAGWLGAVAWLGVPVRLGAAAEVLAEGEGPWRAGQPDRHTQ